ncbi:MAG: hypothetical protein ACKOC6_03040 [bacterium]
MGVGEVAVGKTRVVVRPHQLEHVAPRVHQGVRDERRLERGVCRHDRHPVAGDERQRGHERLHHVHAVTVARRGGRGAETRERQQPHAAVMAHLVEQALARGRVPRRTHHQHLGHTMRLCERVAHRARGGTRVTERDHHHAHGGGRVGRWARMHAPTPHALEQHAIERGALVRGGGGGRGLGEVHGW